MIKFIASVIFFGLFTTSTAQEDYSFLHFTSNPSPDVQYTVWNQAEQKYSLVLICPDGGIPCVVKVTVQGGSYIVNDQKGRNRASVEIV